MDGKLILIVDDDVDFIEITRAVLESGGYRVVSAGDPHAAIQLMAATKPDLVITDLMMKSLDAGFAFCRQIKSDPRFAGVPVILATSAASQRGYDFHPQTPDELAAMKADAFMDKPVPPRVLLEKVRALLG